MKKIFSYIACVAFLLLCTLLLSCKKDETEENQRTALVKYITETLKASVDERDGVYFVLLDTTTIAPVTYVKPNDVVEFEYAAWSLDGTMFATSDDSTAARYGLTVLPKREVRVGAGELIAGLDKGLQRFALGDHGMILFPFTLGYGEQYVGIVKSESALIFEIVVTKLNGVSL